MERARQAIARRQSMSHVLLLDSNVWSHLILGDAEKQEKVKAQLRCSLRRCSRQNFAAPI